MYGKCTMAFSSLMNRSEASQVTPNRMCSLCNWQRYCFARCPRQILFSFHFTLVVHVVGYTDAVVSAKTRIAVSNLCHQEIPLQWQSMTGHSSSLIAFVRTSCVIRIPTDIRATSTSASKQHHSNRRSSSRLSLGICSRDHLCDSSPASDSHPQQADHTIECRIYRH